MTTSAPPIVSPLVSRLAFSGVVVVSAFVCLFQLGSGPLAVFDEALHGELARNMMRAGKYLALVDEHGAYSASGGFSKPPLMLWLTSLSLAVFDPSMFSLRLPSALAVFGLGLTAFFFGKALHTCPRRGLALGVFWAVSLVGTTGALTFGRTSNIEPVFVFFAVLTLFFAFRAHQRERVTWSDAGLITIGLTLAVMTKQIVAVVVAFPLCVQALANWKRGRRHVVLTAVIPLVGAALVFSLWFALAWRVLGDDIVDLMWRFSVQDRISGFGGNRHQLWLNRLADNLTTHATPLHFVPGFIGAFALALVRQTARDDRRVDAAWLLPTFLFSLLLSFELVTRSTLVWYVFGFVPVIALGVSFLVVDALFLLDGDSRWFTVETAMRVGLGVLTWALTVDAASQHLVSRLTLGFVIGICVSVFVLARVSVRRALVPASMGLLALLVGNALQHDSHQSGPGHVESLMALIGPDEGAPVSFDPRLISRGPRKEARARTYFGVDATREIAPWAHPDTSPRRARVEYTSWPNELSPRGDVTVSRGAGGVVLRGDLGAPPFSMSDVDDLLDAGALTFESENCPSGILKSLSTWGIASSREFGVQRERRVRSILNKESKKGLLTKGPAFPIPAGRYEATFHVRYECGGFAWEEKIGSVQVRAGKSQIAARPLTCAPGDRKTHDVDLVLAFDFPEPAVLDLLVQHRRGMLSHDKTVVRRVGRLSIDADDDGDPHLRPDAGALPALDDDTE